VSKVSIRFRGTAAASASIPHAVVQSFASALSTLQQAILDLQQQVKQGWQQQQQQAAAAAAG
jgi:hypothetical protein